MKLLISILLIFNIAQFSFGQNSDTTIVYWKNKNIKYSEYWASTSEKTGFGINESTALKIKTFYNEKGKEISYEDFISTYGQKEVDSITSILSIFYEASEIVADDTNSYIILGYSKPTNIKIDTSIYIDFTSKETMLDSLINSKELLDYYNLLKPPPHGGDPNYATISVIVDTNGKAIFTYVVEDVKNKCNDDPWKLYSDKNVSFSPFVLRGKPYVTEYIFKIMDLMYCVPLIGKESISTNKKEKRKKGKRFKGNPKRK